MASCFQTGIYNLFPPVDFNCVCCCQSRWLSRGIRCSLGETSFNRFIVIWEYEPGSMCLLLIPLFFITRALLSGISETSNTGVNGLNAELNGLRIIICLRKSEVIVERISVSYVVKILMGHGIHCLPCSYTNNVLICYRSNYDVILISKRRHRDAILSKY